MQTREQMYAMLILKKRRDTFFSHLPMELIVEISNYGQDPNSAIAKALHHAAYARDEDVTELLAMLETNPRLLLEAGNVTTPGGDEVRRVTPYEFLLGAGDYELAKKVEGYFAKIENGAQEKIRQYERYRPHIESMLTQNPYDLTLLIELIKKATVEEVVALLNNNLSDKNALGEAMIQFRKDWAPRVLTKPCMHYRYTSLQYAFELLNREWKNLHRLSRTNSYKHNLVRRQLIGFEMRRLPGIDRCALAQGLQYVIEKNKIETRSYAIRQGEVDVEFPITEIDDSLAGLGVDYAVNMHAYLHESVLQFELVCWKTYIEQKFQTWKMLLPPPVQQSGWCIVV